MVTYKNVRTGREITRPYKDEWLEASAGWDRLADEPAPKPSKDEHEGSED